MHGTWEEVYFVDENKHIFKDMSIPKESSNFSYNQQLYKQESCKTKWYIFLHSDMTQVLSSWNPSPSKTKIYLVYVANIIAADDLTT